MAYELEAKQSIKANIRRILSEEVGSAIEELQNPNGNHESIHNARKSFKKVRAVARLVRDEIGEKRYQRANTVFRDVGRQLSASRDSWVLIETLDSLKAEIHPKTFQALRTQLVRRHQDAVLIMSADNRAEIQDVIEVLESTNAEFRKWKIKGKDFRVFRSNVRRIYRRGKDGLASVQQDRSPEGFHSWRKDVKYLWYHFRILSPVWANMFGAYNVELDRLAECLGTAHDLFVLQQELEAFRGQYSIDPVLAVASQRQVDLEEAAVAQGQRLYIDSSKDFVTRIDAQWRLWQK